MTWSCFYPHMITADDGYPEDLFRELPGQNGARSTSGLVNVMPQLQEAEWQWLKTLLVHKNPYTGLRYVDDPALAIVEVHNEDCIFWHAPLNQLATGKPQFPRHAALLKRHWREWLQKRYADDEALKKAWGRGMRSGDSLHNPALGMYAAWELEADGPHFNKAEKARAGDFIRFLAESQRDYYLRRRQQLRELGFQGVTVSTAWQSGGAASDLANLPQFLCRSDDIVLVAKRPSVEFLSGVKQAGFPLAEFVELKEGRIDPASNICERKLGILRPWAWGPDSMELLEPLFARVTGEHRNADQRFNDGIAHLYSKAWSADFLRTVLERSRRRHEAHSPEGERGSLPTPAAGETWLCTEAEIGVSVTTLEGALAAIAAIRRNGHHRVVAKEAHGLAGHNAIRLWEPEVSAAQQRWLAHALQNGRQMVIEPWLERELDFSVQLEMGPRSLKLCGYTGLINDRKGQFQANFAAANSDRRIPGNVAALLDEPVDISRRLLRLYGEILSLLEAELQRADFVGPVGIDAFVYRTPQGGCRLKPVVEINPRYTMGRLTLELMKQTCPGSCGLFRLVSRAQASAKGFASFASYAHSLSEHFPLRLEGEPGAKIREGALCLNEPAQAQACLATFQVSRTLIPPVDGAPEPGFSDLLG